MLPRKTPRMDQVERAVRAAVRVAAWHGIGASDPVVLRNRANLLVHLRPAPVVARIPALSALVRPNPQEWLAREVAVAGYAASRGAAVVPPADELPPGPHRCDGHWMTFARYVEQVDSAPPDALTHGRLVRELHEALAGFPAPLPRLTPLTEIPRMIDAVTPSISTDDVSALRAAYERSVVPLIAASGGAPALHGDSNVHNLVATREGFLWNDFEDTAAGPWAWDLASAAREFPETRSDLLRGHGDDVDRAELDRYVAARDVQGLAWIIVVGTRFPDAADEGRRRLAALPADPATSRDPRPRPETAEYPAGGNGPGTAGRTGHGRPHGRGGLRDRRDAARGGAALHLARRRGAPGAQAPPELPDLLRAAVRLVREAAPDDFRVVVGLNIAIGLLTAVQLGLTQRLAARSSEVGAETEIAHGAAPASREEINPAASAPRRLRRGCAPGACGRGGAGCSRPCGARCRAHARSASRTAHVGSRRGCRARAP